ncbi:unnamed protein product [Urochloa decumbens]|uniref:(S)-ureidoglycine aminohydrolase cupin domain-containing protein n=1 Tax=Urochloa decumbens TaxID=240449 RepID=A0ABC9C9F4_9POAL
MASPMVATPVQLRTSTGRLSFSSSSPIAARRRFGAVRASAETMATEKLGIRVERNPPESRLSELGVRQWPKWGCEKSKFPWTYSAKETCYLLQGKVKVYPEGHGEEFVEIAAGDLVVFPKGMSCTWDVAEAVDKHYNFE